MKQNTHQFSFLSSAYPQDVFRVVSFSSFEAISHLFHFDIILASDHADLNFESIMENPATLTIHSLQGKIQRHGIPAAFEQLQTSFEQTFYRLELVPRLARLPHIEQSRIFLGKNIQEIITEVVADANLSNGSDIEFRLTQPVSLEPREYVVQYQETDYTFISRWMERNGISFFFEHSSNQDKCIFSDSPMAHVSQSVVAKIQFIPNSGLEQDKADTALAEFFATQRPLPKSVMLKDWNYRTPDVKLEAKADVLDSGFGQFYSYGDHFKTPTEGQALAKIRAEEQLCRQCTYSGRSFSPYFDPGFTFDLTDHFRDDFNQPYLVTEVVRQGRQFAPGTAGLGANNKDDAPFYYRSTIKAIPTETPFRPKRKTPWPRISGVINAKIDGSSSASHPDIDEYGRYTVIPVFDRSGRQDGKASSRIRMAQPYGGSDHGMHFPLHKGCEVLLSHVAGDPDRPIIISTVPNPDTPSPVNQQNQTQCRLTTSSGNEIHFEDKTGSERILFNVPNVSTFLRMGAPNDPPSSWFDKIDPSKNEGQHGWKLDTPDWISIIAGAQLEVYLIAYINSVVGIFQDTTGLTKTETNFALVQGITGKKTKILLGCENEIGVLANLFKTKKDAVAANKTDLTDSLINTTGEVTELNTTVQSLNNVVTTLSGQVNQLSTSVEQLMQEKAELIGQITDLAQQRSDIAQTNTELAGQVSELAQMQTDLDAQVNDLATDITELSQQVNELSAQSIEMASQVTRTALTMTNLNGMDLTI